MKMISSNTVRITGWSMVWTWPEAAPVRLVMSTPVMPIRVNHPWTATSWVELMFSQFTMAGFFAIHAAVWLVTNWLTTSKPMSQSYT